MTARNTGVARAIARQRGVARAFSETAKAKHYKGEATYTLRVIDHDKSLLKILEYLQKCSLEGHSVGFKIDDESFGLDGDGADKIIDLKVSKSEE